MKESIGYTATLNIVIIFITVIFAIFAMSLSYYRAYKVSNKITESIEKYEGYNYLAEAEIRTKLTSLGYNFSSVSCRQKLGECSLYSPVYGDNVDDSIKVSKYSGELGYCVYACPTNKTNYVKYKVTTNMMWNIPIINDVLNIPVETKTRELYGFWDAPINLGSSPNTICRIERKTSGRYTIGDVVTCELSESTDKFYVIQNASITAQTIELLPAKHIHTTKFRQSNNAGKITNYEDKISPIIRGYVSYLKSNNLKGTTGSLITMQQLERLGCPASQYVQGNYCQGTSGIEGDVVGTAPSWVLGEIYWAEELSSYSNWYVSSFVDYSSGEFGVRPVITINTSYIK